MMDVHEFADRTVAYQRVGVGAPVVFLHNGGTSHAIWRHTAEALSDRFETFAPDLLGYGDSDPASGDCTLDTYVDMLASLVEGERLVPVSLVGNCMGSAIALRFAMLWPEAVASLVLINPLTEATFAAGAFGSALRLRRRVPRLARAIGATLERMPVPGWAARRAVALQLSGRGDGLPDRDLETLCACYARDEQMSSLLTVLDDMDSYRALDDIDGDQRLPRMCTLWGLDNRVLSAEAGRELNRALRPDREVWLEGCGHLPMLERPDEVSAAIGSFLEEVSRDAVPRPHLQPR